MDLNLNEEGRPRLKLGGSSKLQFQTSSDPMVKSIGLKENILAVNELSAGLAVGIPDTSFLSSFKGVLKNQTQALNDTLLLSKKFQLGALETDQFLGSTVAPISSTIAGMGLATLNANKLYETGSIGEYAFTNAQEISSLCLDAVQEQQNIFNATLHGVQDGGTFNSLSGLIASTEVVSSGVNALLRSLPTYPTEVILPTLESLHGAGEITERELSEHQKKLDKKLYNIDPQLVEYRRGCWETFEKKGKDYIGQSSSSMRRLVDELLRILAPNERVEETHFFKTSEAAKDSKGKPTRKARIYHIAKFEEKKAEHVERLAKGLLEVYGNLSAWDHKPLQQDAFVHGIFVTIEGCLMSLLSEYE